MSTSRDATRLLRLLARLDPRLQEIVNPHLPILAVQRMAVVAGPGTEAALNPQPLPPVEILCAAVRRTAVAVAETAVAARAGKRDARAVLAEAGDDWCPTPPQNHIPWPKRRPAPWPPGEPWPIDVDLARPAVQATAGLVFLAYADGIADAELSAAFTDAADRLIGAALAED